MSDKPAEQAYHARGAGRLRDVSDYSDEIQDILTEFSTALGWSNSAEQTAAYLTATQAIKDLLKYGEPGADTGTTPPRETAWLIERHDMTRTQWLCCDSGEFEWTADPLKPLRLARREDAEQLALLALPNRDDIDVRITEHQWGM